MKMSVGKLKESAAQRKRSAACSALVQYSRACARFPK